MKLSQILKQLVFTVALSGCVTEPTLQRSPEAIADRIGGDVVAYNEAYGRAISDQILLNTLRARDRLPLYYLSMSGITEGSYSDMTGSAQIGAIGLGNGNPNWGIGQIGGSRTNRNFPSYSLNPFGGSKDSKGTTFQFVPINSTIFMHYWYADWPRDMLLYVMVDSVTDLTTPTPTSYSNSSEGMRACAAGAGAPCNFGGIVDLISAIDGPLPLVACDATQNANNPNRCDAQLTSGGRTYAIEFRALDDMIYYVGGTLRRNGANPLVRPLGVYLAPADEAERTSEGAASERTPHLERTARLFSVEAAPADFRSRGYAADVMYRGVHYVAGPANNAHCDVDQTHTCATEINAGDPTADVISLLTQLIIINQTELANLAPRWGDPSSH